MELYLTVILEWLKCFIVYPAVWVAILWDPKAYSTAEAFWWLIPPMVVLGALLLPFAVCMYWVYLCGVALHTGVGLGFFGFVITAVAAVYGASMGLAGFSSLGQYLDSRLGIDAYARLDNILTAMCVMGLASAAYGATKAILKRETNN